MFYDRQKEKILAEVREIIEQDERSYEEVEAEIRGIIEGKKDRADLMANLLSQDIDQEVIEEIIGLVKADIDANDTLMDLLV